MSPSIYPFSLAGTTAQQYLHRARMFLSAASEPALPDYRNGEPFWPKYALVTHAIELSLKAFSHHSIENGKPAPGKEPKQHDLLGWYQLAVDYGLTDEPGMKENIALLNELHFGHFTRYPQNRSIPDASIIADTTAENLILTLTPIINPR